MMAIFGVTQHRRCCLYLNTFSLFLDAGNLLRQELDSDVAFEPGVLGLLPRGITKLIEFGIHFCLHFD
ncbi:MAG: hypothetical protein ACE5G1_17600 [bacterium]